MRRSTFLLSNSWSNPNDACTSVASREGGSVYSETPLSPTLRTMVGDHDYCLEQRGNQYNEEAEGNPGSPQNLSDMESLPLG